MHSATKVSVALWVALNIAALLYGATGARAAPAACFTEVCRDGYDSKFPFVDANTLGSVAHPLPGLPLSRNRDYRDFVNSDQLVCADADCEKGFYCAVHGEKDCHHVHAIWGVLPPACAASCRRVPGNLVMADGRWNSAIVALARENSGAAMLEKDLILGSRAVNASLTFVAECCDLSPDALIAHLAPIVSPILYDLSCESAAPCNCDALGPCGCDCDFETPVLAYLAAVILLNIGTVVLSSIAIMMLTVALCCFCCGDRCACCAKKRSADAFHRLDAAAVDLGAASK